MRPFRLRQLAPETLAAAQHIREALASLRATAANGRELVAASRAQRDKMAAARRRLLEGARPRDRSSP